MGLCYTRIITGKAQFIGFWRKLIMIHCDDKNRGFTRLNVTKKTILTDSIYISADYVIIRRYNRIRKSFLIKPYWWFLCIVTFLNKNILQTFGMFMVVRWEELR
jgi:hypothetical protein